MNRAWWLVAVGMACAQPRLQGHKQLVKKNEKRTSAKKDRSDEKGKLDRPAARSKTDHKPVRQTVPPKQITTFSELLKFCTARSRLVKTAQAYKKHAQGWSEVKILSPFVPHVRFEAHVGRLAAIERESFRFRLKSIFEGLDYYTRSAGIVISWQFNGFQELFERADVDAQATLAASTYAQESAAFATRLFMVLTMLKLHQEAVNAYKKQIDAYERYYKIMVERLRAGDLINEQTKDDTTVGQLTARKAEAYARLAEATKKYRSYSMEFELMTDGTISIDQVEIPALPVAPHNVSLQDFMRRDMRLNQAWVRVCSAQALVGRANATTFSPRVGLDLKAIHKYDYIAPLKFDLPLDLGATVTLGLNLLNMREFVTTAQHTSEYHKARCEYETQLRNATEDAFKRTSDLECNPPAIKAQHEALEENKQEMYRLSQILGCDASDHVALQKYAEAIGRYTETITRYESLLHAFVESCFLLATPLVSSLPQILSVKLSPKKVSKSR